MSRFWTTAELLERGKSPRDIRRAAEAAVLREVRKGHWSTAGSPPEVVRAARVGGVATATTAGRAMGLWTPPDPAHGPVAFRSRPPDRLQVAVPNTAGRLKDPDDPSRPLGSRLDVVTHWVELATLAGTGIRRIAPPLMVLQHAFLSLPPERALTMLDSAIRLRFVRPRDVPALQASLPERLRAVAGAWDRADSGTETIARYLLRRRGLRVEVLVVLDGLGEVDLLIEGRLIVELDGKEFHTADEAFDNDRRRDMVAAQQRYRTLRFTWYRVLFEWPEVEAAVLGALAA